MVKHEVPVSPKAAPAGSNGEIDPRFLVIARAIGHQIARELYEKGTVAETSPKASGKGGKLETKS